MYLQNIKFYEGWIESYQQVMLNAGAMAMLGIESPLQYLSFALSFATLTKCLAERISYLKHNQEPKLFSITFLIDLLEVIIMYLLCFLGHIFLLLTNNHSTPLWIQIFFVLTSTPIIWFPLMRFTRLLSNMLFYLIFAIRWILYLGLFYLINFVSSIR